MASILNSLCGQPKRLQSLRRFAVTITIVTVLAHCYLGLETSFAVPVIGVLSALAVQLFLEWVRCSAAGCTPGYRKGRLVDYLLPAYIVGMTCAMFLFTNGRPWPIIFAVTLAIGSKFILRINVGERSLHFLNPSNLAILVTLLAFPSVALVMPYSFSTVPQGVGDSVLPAVLFVGGCLLNGIYTKRLLLILAWFAAFAIQALLRYFLLDAQLLATFAVATGPVSIIFSFFMISDPATTPDKPLGQVAFGASIGLFYFVLTAAHVVYGLFWALLITCAVRGVYLFLTERQRQQAPEPSPQTA